MKISVFVNPSKKEEKEELKREIEKIALSFNFEIDEENPDVVFACGGDGTMLRGIHTYFKKLDSIKFFGANFGHLGFFYNYEKDEVVEALKALKDSELEVTTHKFIKADIENNDGSISTIYAINEFRIEDNINLIETNVSIDGEFFESYAGTGLSISTPIGSTAYNLLLGGSAVSPEMECIQIVPVQASSFSKSFKSSLVLPPNKTIVLEGPFNNVLLGNDHVVREKVSFKSIKISSCNYEFKLLNKKGNNSLSRLIKLFS